MQAPLLWRAADSTGDPLGQAKQRCVKIKEHKSRGTTVMAMNGSSSLTILSHSGFLRVLRRVITALLVFLFEVLRDRVQVQPPPLTQLSSIVSSLKLGHTALGLRLAPPGLPALLRERSHNGSASVSSSPVH